MTLTKISILGAAVMLSCSGAKADGQSQAIYWTNCRVFNVTSFVATNYPVPVLLEPNPHDWGINGTTNIVINTNYTGTIQIGTNFYTRKDFADLAVIPKGNYPIWRADVEAQKTKWLNSPMTIKATVTATNSVGEPAAWEQESALHFWTEPDILIGLRSDGVVVWKHK
jgi:hypothetical protein